MQYVTASYCGESLIAKNYQDVYQDIINDLAYLMFRPNTIRSLKYVEELNKAAIKYLIKAEQESIKVNVDSDYDFFIEDDQGGLFDLVSYFYESKANFSKESMQQVIGQRIIRNYELKAMRKINRDILDAFEDIKDGRIFGGVSEV